MISCTPRTELAPSPSTPPNPSCASVCRSARSAAFNGRSARGAAASSARAANLGAATPLLAPSVVVPLVLSGVGPPSDSSPTPAPLSVPRAGAARTPPDGGQEAGDPLTPATPPLPRPTALGKAPPRALRVKDAGRLAVGAPKVARTAAALAPERRGPAPESRSWMREHPNGARGACAEAASDSRAKNACIEARAATSCDTWAARSSIICPCVWRPAPLPAPPAGLRGCVRRRDPLPSPFVMAPTAGCRSGPCEAWPAAPRARAGGHTA